MKIIFYYLHWCVLYSIIILRGDKMSDKDKLLENLTQELKRGTLVLSVLLNTNEPRYGYSLVQTLQDLGIDIEQNTLYPLLRRLEKQGLLESHWDTTENRPRKYYKISSFGEVILSELSLEWRKMSNIIQNMLS